MRDSLGDRLKFLADHAWEQPQNAQEPTSENVDVLLVLIDACLDGSTDNESGSSELLTTLRDASESGARIIPVLLPGIPLPRSNNQSELINILLCYTVMQLREDPEYSTDLRRLLDFCQQITTPRPGFIVTPLPDSLAPDARNSIRALVGAMQLLHNHVLAMAENPAIADRWNEAELKSQAIANSTIDYWGEYFDL